MAKIRGEMQYKKWESGKLLTRKEAILAKCYECNGFKESAVDCKCYTCPIYQYHPHNKKKKKPVKRAKTAVLNN